MLIRHTEEELKLAAVFEPYLVAGKLQENAPQEVQEALERYDALFEESYRRAFEDTYGWSWKG